MMRRIFTAILGLTLLVNAGAAHAGGNSSEKARKLLSRLRQHPPKVRQVKDTPLLVFLTSPKVPLQNQNLSIVVQSENYFTGRDLTIEADLNGSPVGAVQSPTRGLFVVALGLQTKVGPSTLNVSLYGEDPTTNTEIRTAVKALDTDISRLTAYVNIERDPAKRAILQEQRSEKVALKSELLTQLKAFRVKLGSQAFAFTVQADPSSISQPRITSVSPSVGGVGGGTIVTISGANFGLNPSVLFGGIASPDVTRVNDTTIQAVTPSFLNATGAKDVEVRFPGSQGTVNVISSGAFFAVNFPVSAPQNPVAIASGSQVISLGSSVQLDGSLSYAARPSLLSYNWTFVSAPSGSNYVPGQSLGSTVNPSFTPNRAGTYVLQLVVQEINTVEHLESQPSIAVVQVDASPHPTAAGIVVNKGASATTQVFANDPVAGEAVYFSIIQVPAHGSASITNSGLVSYAADNSFVGNDSLVVKVTGQSGLFGTVTIPITVNDNSPPPPPANPPAIPTLVGAQMRQGSPYTCVFGTMTPNTPIAAPNGLASLTWNFGDGTSAPAPSYAVPGSSGVAAVEHNYLLPGTYTATLTAVDDLGGVGTGSVTLTVVDGALPKPIFTLDAFSGSTPLTVNFNASGASSPNGIANYIWSAGGAFAPQFGVDSSFTFSDPGVYPVSLLAIDANGGMGVSQTMIYAGVSAPHATAQPVVDFAVTPSWHGLVNVAKQFDGTRSFDPNQGGSIASYAWNLGDFMNCPDGCSASGSMPTHAYSAPMSFFPSLVVTSQAGVVSSPKYLKVQNVTQGLAPSPQANFSQQVGVAPLEVSGNASSSYDADGTIQSYFWNFGDYGSCQGGCTSTSAQASHVYSSPGFYLMMLSVTDNDGNISMRAYPVMVASSSSSLNTISKTGKLSTNADETGAIMGACAQGNGAACFALSEIYKKQGNEVAANVLKARACSLKYQPACESKNP